MDIAWFVAQITPGYEQRAKKDLDDRVGVWTFLPMVEDYVVKRGVKVAQPRLLMEGYIFVFFNKGDADQWAGVCGALGVHTLLPSNAWPANLDQGWMEKFQASISADGLMHIEKEDKPWLYQVGKYVRVPDGLPFESFGGICTSANSREVEVQVNVFGRFTPVTIPQAAISKENISDKPLEDHVVKVKMFGYKRSRKRTAI